MNHFFITGLPRSRTAWLANLMTYAASFCWHDAMSFCGTPSNLYSLFQNHREDGYDYLGNSDSSLVIHWKTVVSLFPKAKWVTVMRNPDEVFESFWNRFHASYPHGPTTEEEAKKTTWDLFGRIGGMLKELPNNVVVPYTMLGDPAFPEMIWKHCTPTLPFNSDRLKMLETFQINIMPRKVAFK